MEKIRKKQANPLDNINNICYNPSVTLLNYAYALISNSLFCIKLQDLMSKRRCKKMAKLTESYESIMVLSTTLGEDGL
ncbi:MAG: hypothetical protein RR205_03635, partial [Oscillospiraceae bacterium]